MRAPLTLLPSLASLAVLGSACNLIFSISPGEPAGSGGALPDAGTGDASGGQSTGGSAPCAARCEGAVLHACDGDGKPLPDTTCAAVADCDPIAGRCLDPALRPRLAVGYGRACVIGDDAVLRCWGINSGASLVPDEPRPYLDTAALVADVPNVRQVALGSSHVCAVLEDATVTCWGTNDSGETGVAPGSPMTPAPVEMPDQARAIEVSLTDRCSCARLADGRVACWGRDDTGCFGNVPTTSDPRPTPTIVPGLSSVVELHVGSGLATAPSCARLAGGEVRCWSPTLAPTEVPGVADAVAIGVSRELVIIQSAAQGLLWTKQSGGGWLPADAYKGAPATKALSVGEAACVLREDGKVACAILSSVSPQAPAPVPSPPAGTVVEIAAGYGWRYGVGLQCLRLAGASLSGSVYCWGDDAGYALGAGAPHAVRTPQKVPNLSGTKGLSCAQSSTTVVRSDGSVAFWGGTSAYNGLPALPVTPAPLFGTGNAFAMSHDPQRQAYAVKDAGSLALLDTGAPLTGQRLLSAAFTDWALALQRANWDIGLRKNGSVVVYARNATGNEAGLFGDGSTTATANQWVTVPSIADATALAAYGSDYNSVPAHVCVLRGAGAVSCWGTDYAGEIGGGDPPGGTASTPRTVTIPGGAAAVSIAVGRVFSAAVTADGKVYTWGLNADGQLGAAESVTSVNTPIQVTGIDNAVGVAAGDVHACAWLADKKVVCWGLNDSAQLGDGTFTKRFSPVMVDNLDDVVQVSAGPEHTCARHSDGSISCWGSSYDGQVGTGVDGNFESPLAVQGL